MTKIFICKERIFFFKLGQKSKVNTKRKEKKGKKTEREREK